MLESMPLKCMHHKTDLPSWNKAYCLDAENMSLYAGEISPNANSEGEKKALKFSK